jgi:hypothetical protein
MAATAPVSRAKTLTSSRKRPPSKRDERRHGKSAVTTGPLATLLSVVSAILIVLGRVNHDLWWGNWIAVAGFAMLVVGAALVLLPRR